MRDPRYSSWVEKKLHEDLTRYYTHRTLDVYDIWLIMNLLYDGTTMHSLEIERAGGKTYFTLDTPSISYGVYDPEKRTFTTKYEHIPGPHLNLKEIHLNIPESIEKLKVKGKEKWLITRRNPVNWDYAPRFKPNIYIQGRIWSDDGVKGWLQRKEDEFAYVAILGTIVAPYVLGEDPKPVFYEREVFIAQGAFLGDTIQLIHNFPHSPKIIPRRVIEQLQLKEGL
ncbi:MAG: hypothetical protein J7K48_03220 [Thermococcus sp.]|nr:hypothetical protein [Thermococcus sp.]